MSADAKEWKKDRLRQRGVRVIERRRPGRRRRPGAGAGRAAATSSTTSNPSCCSSATPPPRTAWRGSWPRRAGRRRTSAVRLHPLRRRRAGRHHPWTQGAVRRPRAFAEPVASPCMLVQLAAGMQTPTSVYDLGLDNRTEADGLAVGQASELVASLMTPQLGGVFTVSDDELYLNLLALKDSLDAEVEPRPPPPSRGRAGCRARPPAAPMPRAWPWPTPRTSSGPLADRWCRVMRCAASRNTPGRCVRAARPEPPRSDIPRISGRAPADPQPIPGRPPYQQRHSKETTRERQRFPTPAGPQPGPLKTRPTERSRYGSSPS